MSKRTHFRSKSIWRLMSEIGAYQILIRRFLTFKVVSRRKNRIIREREGTLFICSNSVINENHVTVILTIQYLKRKLSNALINVNLITSVLYLMGTEWVHALLGRTCVSLVKKFQKENVWSNKDDALMKKLGIFWGAYPNCGGRRLL